MGFTWGIAGGSSKSFDAEPYDMTMFDIWGKEISAPDGSLITYGAGMLKVKFKSLPVKISRTEGKYPFNEFSKDWEYAQYMTQGKMNFNLWSPKTQNFVSCRAVPKWPDPSGKFNGPNLEDFELEIFAPFLAEDYSQGPITSPYDEPPIFTDTDINGGFGVGDFGAEDFGTGEDIS